MSQDRRRYFRIALGLQLAVSRLGGSEQAPGGREADAIADIDRRIRAIVETARVQAPAVAELAELLNRKLDYVIDTLRLGDAVAQHAVFRETTASLSACGIGFSSPEPYPRGEELQLDLLLPPGSHHIRVQARVVGCDRDDIGDHLLHLDFTAIETEDQEFLIQYILRRQGKLLQQQREAREAGPPDASR